MKPMIVICSNDSEFYLLLRHILEADGYESVLVGALFEMNAALHNLIPDAILVDFSPDNIEAIRFCKQVKSEETTKTIPIAALVSPDSAHQFVNLIKVGVDDGFVRPLVPGKLLQFLRAAKSQSGVGSAGLMRGTETALRRGELEINPEAHCAWFKGRKLELTPTGFRLLSHLLQYPNCVHSRADLIEVIWDGGRGGVVDSRTVDVHVGRLRKSLQTQRHMSPIKTIRSSGYMFVA